MLKITKMIVNTRNRSRLEPRYIHCKRCNKQIPQNKTKMCNKCRNETVQNAREGYNNNKGEDEAIVLQEQLGEMIIHNNNINKKNTELKNQGFIDSKKHEDYI